MKKVLITGGAGFIGLALAKHYISKGYRVDIIDNFSRGAHDKELQSLINNPCATLYELDLLNEQAIADTLPKDYTYIFHLAAIIGVINVLKQPYDVLEKNLKLLTNMLSFAKSVKGLQRFLFASTSEVYAGTLRNFEMAIPTPESTPLCATDLNEPRTSYMLSKIYGEALCNFSGLPITNFRPHNIYGPRMGMAHVIPELLYRAYNLNTNQLLDVYSTTHKRTFCYIDDTVKLLFLAAQVESTLGKTINVGNQHPEIAMGDLAKIILQVVGKSNAINPMPITQGSPTRRCPDMTMTTNLLNFTAKITLDEGIKQTFKWYKENNWCQ